MTQPLSPTPPTPTRTPVIVPEHLRELDLVDPSYDWRPGQRELVSRVANSPKKIVMLEAECGTGKSIIGAAAAKSAGADAIVLIQTIALQEQYMRDMGDHAAKMMSGRSHFTCNRNNKRADWAPCTVGIKCHMKGAWDPQTGMPVTMPECDYYRAKAEAKLAGLSIQNYAYWLSETRSWMSSFNKASWIICDEGHELDLLLMAAATIEANTPEIRSLGLDLPDAPQAALATLPIIWKNWAGQNIARVRATVAMLEEAMADGMVMEDDMADTDDEHYDETIDASTSVQFESKMSKLQVARRVLGTLEDLNSIPADKLDEWVVAKDGGKPYYEIKPIYGKYGFQRILNAATDKVVIMSAFLAPQLLIKTLGLDPNDVEIISVTKVFDRSDSPIYYCPVFPLGYKTPENEWKLVVKAIDRFVNFMRPKKGLLHVPSIHLRNRIMAGTANKLSFIAYDGVATDANARKYAGKDVAIARFIASREQVVLIGQSISTGLDIPYEPQWQIIVKLAYLPLDDPAVKRRNEVDPNFYPYYAICQIVQATGRVKRAQDHAGTTIILDANFGWFHARNRAHFPAWFENSLVYDGWKQFDGIFRGIKNLDAPLCGVFVWPKVGR